MSLQLRAAVLRGLRILGADCRLRSGGILEVELPAPIRHHFSGRQRLVLVFEHAVWQHDRRSDLVVPGSAILRGLEAALQERGGTVIRIGGELIADPASSPQIPFEVLNGTLIEIHPRVHLELVLRILYEVRLPEPADAIELVPIAWSPGSGLLSPGELAALEARTWYEAAEVSALPGLTPATLGEWDRMRGREAAEAELRQRLQPFLQGQVHQRAQQAAERERRYRQEARERAAEAASLADPDRGRRLAEIEEELEARLAQSQRLQTTSFQVRERTLQLLQLGRCEHELEYQLIGSGQRIRVPLPGPHDPQRAARCGACAQLQPRYYLSPTSDTHLLCEACGVLCAAPGCSTIAPAQAPDRCTACARSRFCSAHTHACASCGARVCPEHSTVADCCGAVLCGEHRPVAARDGRLLCPRHHGTCAVDELPTHTDDLVTCPLSGATVSRANAAQPPGDDRLLHPDQVVELHDGRILARDRAGRCAVDGAWLPTTQLLELHGDRVCPQHTCTVDQPPGQVVRSDRVHTCADTGQRLAPSAAGICSVDGQAYWTERLMRCPVTDQLLFVGNAVSLDGQQLHPDAVVTCVHTGRRLVRSEAASCSVGGGPLAPEAAVHTAAGRIVCPEHAVRVELPPGEIVAADQVRICAETGARLAPRLARRCSVRDRIYREDLVRICPVTGSGVHHEAAVRLPGDDRALHPDAIVRCGACGEPIAQDRAVREELGERRWLHPAEAQRCERSGLITAADALVVADCCGRRIHRDATGPSPIDGRTWCLDHGQRCEAHDAIVLQDQARTCAITGRALCPEHAVEALCGLTVARTEALEVPGGWGCSRHFVRCGPGDHAVRIEASTPCPICGAPLCAQHAAHDPYEPGIRSCPSHLRRCPTCLLSSPFEGTICRHCRVQERLTTDHPAMLDYRSQVRPRLPVLLRVAPTVWVSGTPRARLFQIRGALGAVDYLLQDGRLSQRGTAGWEPIR